MYGRPYNNLLFYTFYTRMHLIETLSDFQSIIIDQSCNLTYKNRFFKYK